jgi:WD40 repeat protein
MDPLSSHKITGKWTPPLTKNQLILGMGVSQGATNTAVLASQGFSSFVFSSDVAANTFGPLITLPDSIFAVNDSPVVAIDTQTNQAVVAASNGGVFDIPQIAEVDLATGDISQFTGLGFGYVNGIAVDSQNHIACTSTEIDFSLEFYNLTTHTGFVVPLHNATNQSQSGRDVAFDPIHKLFFVGQEFSSTALSGSSIQIFDEHGNFVKAINGLSLPASPAHIALNPSRRMGYVIVTPALTQLQSFTY